MAERFAFVLALGDGDGNRVLAGFQMTEVEPDGIGGRAGTPARARIVGGREAVPEVPRDGALVAESSAVAAPRRVGESLLAVDVNDVFLGVELVAVFPAAMAGADVTQTYVFGAVGKLKLHGQPIGGEKATIVLSAHFQHVTGIKQGDGMLLQRLLVPFVVVGIGEEIQ